MILVVAQGVLTAIVTYLAFHLTVHPVDKRLKKVTIFRVNFSIVACKFTMIGCCVGALILSALQYHISDLAEVEKEGQITNLVWQVQSLESDACVLTNRIDNLTHANSVLTNQVIGLENRVAQLIDEFASNSATAAPIRLAILNDENEKLNGQIQDLQGQHEIFNFTNIALQAIRNERDFQISNRDSIIEAQKQQATVQQQIADIKAQDQARQDEQQKEMRDEQAKEQQIQTEQNNLAREKSFAKRALPVFDYTVSSFSAMLNQLAKETGLKLHSDIQGALPTIYASRMVSNGVIVDETNYISIGTNTAWNFQVSTAHIPTVFPVWRDPYWGPNSAHYIGLNIVGQGKNGESTVIIAPVAVFRDQGFGMYFIPQIFSQILIKLDVPNGLNIDEKIPGANYEKEIDKALRGLIESQDQQSPLQ